MWVWTRGSALLCGCAGGRLLPQPGAQLLFLQLAAHGGTEPMRSGSTMWVPSVRMITGLGSVGLEGAAGGVQET